MGKPGTWLAWRNVQWLMIPLNPVDFETEMTGRMDGGRCWMDTAIELSYLEQYLFYCQFVMIKRDR